MIFVASDGVRIHCRSHIRESARADVLVLHGMGEHSGRYEEFAARLGRAGCNVHLMDWRGHGCSEGLSGHVVDFNQFHRDFEGWVAGLEANGKLSKERPLFLFTHSLGGLIAVDYFLSFRDANPPQLAGLVLSSPAVGILNPAAILKPVFDLRFPALLEQLHFPNGIKAADLTHDKEKRAEYDNDPLVHGKITISLFRGMLAAIERATIAKSAFPCPVLVIYAEDDRVVDPEAVQKFAKNLKAEDKEVRGFRGFFHEVFNETKRDEAYKLLVGWLDKWTKPAKKNKSSSAKSSAHAPTAKATSRSLPVKKARSTSTSKRPPSTKRA